MGFARREIHLSPQVKYFLLTVPGRCFVCESFVLFMSFVCYAFASFAAALWSPVEKCWPLGSCLSCLVTL